MEGRLAPLVTTLTSHGRLCYSQSMYLLSTTEGCPVLTKVSRHSGGFLGHPRILPWCPLRHRPPCCLEDPLDIPESSLGFPSHTGPHAVRRIPYPWCPLRHRPPSCPEDIPWTSWDPPFVSLSHSCPCCPEGRNPGYGMKGGSRYILGILDPPKTERTRLDCLRRTVVGNNGLTGKRE